MDLIDEARDAVLNGTPTPNLDKIAKELKIKDFGVELDKEGFIPSYALNNAMDILKTQHQYPERYRELATLIYDSWMKLPEEPLSSTSSSRKILDQKDQDKLHDAVFLNKIPTPKEKEQLEPKIDIWKWRENRKTGQLYTEGIDVIKAKAWLLSNYHFITVGEKIYSTLYYDNGYYRQGGEKIIQEAMQKITKGQYLTIQTVREIVAHIQRETFTPQERLLQTSKSLICLRNGVLDVKTKELRAHDPQIIFTQQHPITYDPKADCPAFKKFLDEVVDPKDLPVIQELLGHLLIRDYKYKKAFILVGVPNSGKTTFLKVVVAFIGKENTSSISLHHIVKDKFAAIHLKDKLLNFYDDLSSEDINDAGALKVVTGNGYLAGEHKFGERVHFENYAKLVFACNEIFGLKNKDLDDEAYYGRWIIFFFNNAFEADKQDKTLFDRLNTPEELSGILNWALVGLDRLQENGSFSYAKTPDEVKALMQRGSNNIAAFAQDCLEEVYDAWVSKESLYEAYCAYVKQEGGARQTKEKLGRELPKFAPYCMDSKKDKETGWRNVKLNQAFHTNFKLILDKEDSIFPYARDDKKSMNSMISQALDNHKKGLDLNLLSANLKAAGYDLTLLDEEVNRLKGSGEVYEPRPGVLMRLE